MASMPSIKAREIRIAPEIPVSKTLKFWEGLKEGKVYATKCTKCGKLYFPPTADCPECMGSAVEWVQLKPGLLGIHVSIVPPGVDFPDKPVMKSLATAEEKKAEPAAEPETQAVKPEAEEEEDADT